MLEELPPWAAELLDAAPVARLGLVDPDGQPRVLPITFARCGEALVSAIDHKPKRSGAPPARVAWLRASPRAALTVDLYDEDWERLAWVQVLGSVEVLQAGAAVAELRALSAKYPQYRGRVPQGPVLALSPRRVLRWRAAGD